MCAICGLLGPVQLHTPDIKVIVQRMSDTMRHRGPDAEGVWADPETGIALGHRRLSIIDLSSSGAQPMASACGRYMLVFNGEIYNYLEIRDDLAKAGHRVRGASDSEVLVEAIARWGLRSALDRFNGMFAFAVWDRINRKLILARDRLGEKPLYYGRAGGYFIFSSELKAIQRHPNFNPKVSIEALGQFLKFGYVPSPLSIYEDIRKLPPAHCLIVPADCPFDSAPEPYWSPPQFGEVNGASFLDVDDVAQIDALESLIRDAVKLRMRSDVPLGAFLSGGIDSSSVVALMQAQSDRRIQTFSIGFQEQGYDEAPHAKAVADYLGTDHIEYYVSSSEALSVIPELPTIYDEPFADSSQIPTILVSRIARRYVTVSLSGDGGDELFCGYDRYFLAPRLWNKVKIFPMFLRSLLAAAGQRVPARLLDAAFAWAVPTLNKFGAPTTPSSAIRRAAGYLSATNRSEFYFRLLSQWPAPSEILPDFTDKSNSEESIWNREASSYQELMMTIDRSHYLPDDILVKVDRATMSCSLEGRIPFLDHRVVEFAARLPHRLKVRNGQGKWILREVLGRHVPKKLFERPKMGFGVPIGVWLRAPLKEWAEDLIANDLIKDEGIFRAAPVNEAWREHLGCKRDRHYELWTVLMFLSWARVNPATF